MLSVQAEGQSSVQAAAGFALVANQRSPYESLFRTFSNRIDWFESPRDVPWDRYYRSYIIDLESGDFRCWNWPVVEQRSYAESSFAFVAASIASVVMVGVLPPRSVVFEKGDGLLLQLHQFLVSSADSEDMNKRMIDVDYFEALQILVFKFLNGKNYAVRVGDFDAADTSAVNKVSVMPDGYGAMVEQESGNVFEIPWDGVLYHAETDYPYYKSHSVIEEGRRAVKIGQRVREERLKRKWTLAVLQDKTQIRVPNLSRIEKGKHVPLLDTLERIADAFGIGVSDLIVANR